MTASEEISMRYYQICCTLLHRWQFAPRNNRLEINQACARCGATYEELRSILKYLRAHYVGNFLAACKVGQAPPDLFAFYLTFKQRRRRNAANRSVPKKERLAASASASSSSSSSSSFNNASSAGAPGLGLSRSSENMAMNNPLYNKHAYNNTDAHTHAHAHAHAHTHAQNASANSIKSFLAAPPPPPSSARPLTAAGDMAKNGLAPHRAVAAAAVGAASVYLQRPTSQFSQKHTHHPHHQHPHHPPPPLHTQPPTHPSHHHHLQHPYYHQHQHITIKPHRQHHSASPPMQHVASALTSAPSLSSSSSSSFSSSSSLTANALSMKNSSSSGPSTHAFTHTHTHGSRSLPIYNAAATQAFHPFAMLEEEENDNSSAGEEDEEEEEEEEGDKRERQEGGKKEEKGEGEASVYARVGLSEDKRKIIDDHRLPIKKRRCHDTLKHDDVMAASALLGLKSR